MLGERKMLKFLGLTILAFSTGAALFFMSRRPVPEFNITDDLGEFNGDDTDRRSEDHAVEPKEEWDEIHIAVDRGDEEYLTELLQNGADTEARIAGGFTPLYQAVDRKRPDLIGGLLQFGADPSAKADGGWTPFLCAAIDAPVAVLQAFLDAGADINSATDEGLTALHIATANEHQEAITFLVEAGSDTQSLDNYGNTAADLTDSTDLKNIIAPG